MVLRCGVNVQTWDIWSTNNYQEEKTTGIIPEEYDQKRWCLDLGFGGATHFFFDFAPEGPKMRFLH